MVDVSGRLQIFRVNVVLIYGSETRLAPCDAVCSHTWMTFRLASNLKLQVQPIW